MFLYFGLLVVISLCFAFPEFELCLLDTWIGGEPFNQFGIANYTSGGDEECVLVGVPSSFSPCETFVINLTSTEILGHKVAVSTGTLSPGLTFTLKETPVCRHSFHNVQTVTSYRWTAPPDNTQSVLFGGLCGDMTTNSIMFAADYLTATLNNKDAQEFPGGCPLDALASEDTQPPNLSDDIQSNTPLLAGIGGGVIGGIGLVGLIALRRRKASDNTITEKVEVVGKTVKQGVNTIRASIRQNQTGANRMPMMEMTTAPPSAMSNQNFSAYGSQQDQARNSPPSQQTKNNGYVNMQPFQQGYAQGGYSAPSTQAQRSNYGQYQQPGYGGSQQQHYASQNPQQQYYASQNPQQQQYAGGQNGQLYQNYANYNNNYGLTANNPSFRQ